MYCGKKENNITLFGRGASLDVDTNSIYIQFLNSYIQNCQHIESIEVMWRGEATSQLANPVRLAGKTHTYT